MQHGQSTTVVSTAQPNPATNSTNFGRPWKTMSFQSFLREKTSRHLDSGHSHSGSKKKKAKAEESNVTINIGMKHFVHNSLKTVWGKRLPITVNKSSSYVTVLETAKTKWKAFNRNFDSNEEHVLLYEDGSSAQFMPGGQKDFFILEKYKRELGKDYKRIVLFICTAHDYDTSEGICPSVSENTTQAVLLTTHNEEQVSSDEILAREIEIEWNRDVESDIVEQTSTDTSNIDSTADVYDKLRSKVDKTQQFFLATRRGVPLSRLLRLWQRQAEKTPSTCSLKIKYSGEDGIDQGALSKEFLEDVIQDIGKEMFPDGNPVKSTFHIQRGNFRTCGEISAMSLAQGGPPPCFLELSVYECMYKDDVDLMNIKDSDLTTKELDILKDIRNDYTGYTDLILENNYTGLLDQEHINDIINSMKVSYVSQRSVYMKEFLKGLNVYGLGNIISSCPEICQKLFVGDHKKDTIPDSNYLFSLFNPDYCEQGSSRRVIEEAIMDYFQDTLQDIEDALITGYTAPIAWNYTDDNREADTETTEKFQSPELSVSGVMGWLTGQRHRAVGNWEEVNINVHFDHDCQLRNPGHTICFPVVGACARDITIPVAHMNDKEKFRETFILAYCKGQSFGRH